MLGLSGFIKFVKNTLILIELLKSHEKNTREVKLVNSSKKFLNEQSLNKTQD